MTLNATTLAALSAKAMSKGAAIIGSPYVVCRPGSATDMTNLSAFAIGNLLAQFSQSYNYNRVPKHDDVFWNTIADPTNLQPGDFLVGQLTYYVASTDFLLPLSCARCNGTVTHLRENSQLSANPNGGQGNALPSQIGGAGRYFGQSRLPATQTSDIGELTLAKNVPAVLIASAGRATGNGELPDDAPGPARWRIYTPPSVFPEGSILNRDIFIDGEGHRYQVNAAQWAEMGYRSEVIRLEM